jgi:hypothetical protein
VRLVFEKIKIFKSDSFKSINLEKLIDSLKGQEVIPAESKVFSTDPKHMELSKEIYNLILVNSPSHELMTLLKKFGETVILFSPDPLENTEGIHNVLVRNKNDDYDNMASDIASIIYLGKIEKRIST